MARKCTICEHPQVEAINAALVGGASYRDIARQFAVSKDALFRHRQHLPAELVKAQEAKEIAQADNLLEQLKDLQRRTLSILQAAEQDNDHATALKAIKEARGNLELLAKLLGELAERQVINILVAPEWINLRAVILAALEPYAEARQALAEALREVENRGFAGR